jgi:superfamily I DNA and/or RNA helicase
MLNFLKSLKFKTKAFNFCKFDFAYMNQKFYRKKPKSTNNIPDSDSNNHFNYKNNQINQVIPTHKKKHQKVIDKGFVQEFLNKLKDNHLDQDFTKECFDKIFCTEEIKSKLFLIWLEMNNLSVETSKNYSKNYFVSKKISFKDDPSRFLVLNFSYNNKSEYLEKIYTDMSNELYQLRILKYFSKGVISQEIFKFFSQAVKEKDYEFIRHLIKLETFIISRLNSFYKVILESLDLEVIEKVSEILYENCSLQKSLFVSEKDMKYFNLKTFLIYLELGTNLVDNIRSKNASQEMISENMSNDFITFQLRNNTWNRSHCNLLPDNSFTKNDSKLQAQDYVLIEEKEKSDTNAKYLGEIISIEYNYNTRIRVSEKIPIDKIYTIKKLTTSVPTDVYLNNLIQLCTKKEVCCEKIRKLIIHSRFLDEEENKIESKLKWEALAKEKIEDLNDFNENKTLDNDQLTDAQRQAVLNSIYQKLTLIQGPPGTGKTKIASEIVKEWLNLSENINKSNNTSQENTNGSENISLSSDVSSPILVTADSNIAVDNIFNELQKMKLKPLRIGLHSNAEQFFGTKDFHGILRKNPNMVKVICTTCVGSDADSLRKIKFERVIIDEAGQSTEIANVISFIKNAKQIVIIGDQKQLPPVSFSKLALKYGYSLSLFERLINIGINPILLDVQYRMHPSIAYFPSTFFYNGLLKNGVTCNERILEPSRFVFPNKEIPIAFIPVNGKEERNNNSYRNSDEIEKVKEVLYQLLEDKKINKNQVGIITPYSSQKEALINNLKIPYLEIQSVDGFQGREKDIIIFSAVRSNIEVFQFKIGNIRIFKR